MDHGLGRERPACTTEQKILHRKSLDDTSKDPQGGIGDTKHLECREKFKKPEVKRENRTVDDRKTRTVSQRVDGTQIYFSS